MCYAKPGPRCSSHARTALEKAHAAFRADPSDANHAAWRNASHTYDSTNDGQKEIQQKLSTLPPESDSSSVQLMERDLLTDRLDRGRNIREQALQAYKEIHQGRTPVVTSVSPYRMPANGVDLASRGGATVRTSYTGDLNGYHEAPVTKVRMRDSIAAVMGCTPDKVGDDLMQYGKSLKLDSPASYRGTVGADEDGEYSVVHMRKEKVAALSKWYHNQDNASDEYGVLEYARSQGQSTAGMTPAEAVKAQLRSSGKDTKLADDCDIAIIGPVPMSSIRTRKTPRTSTAPSAPRGTVDGVVIKTGNTFVLVDGDARTEELRGQSAKNGRYVILVPSERAASAASSSTPQSKITSPF